MKRIQASTSGNSGLPSLFAVAFLSSALTVTMAGFILWAVSFALTDGVVPVFNFLKTAGLFADYQITKDKNGNLTQVAKLDTSVPFRGKSSITASVAFKSKAIVITEVSTDTVIDSKDAEPEMDAIAIEFEEPVTGFEQSTNLPEGIPAMLRRKNNGIEIGNFRSVTMDGAADECLNLGYSMLSAAKANQDLLDVMVTNKQITIANICASNGKVVFSCRNGKISISPRRARPDDSCSRA
jgi:hypothetical protein